jgi:hypothetical protein
MESPKHGFKSTATWLMPLPEQLLRFFDFGEILPRIEIDEDWREHLWDGRRSTILDAETRKSKRAAQFESLRLLASGDFKGPIEASSASDAFGGSRRNKSSPWTRCSSASSQCWPDCSVQTINSRKIFNPVSSCPAAAFARATCIPQNGSQR